MPDPDGSIRPSPEQRAAAPVEHRAERLRAQHTTEERTIHEQLEALVDPGLGDFTFEVRGTTVELDGRVFNAPAIAHLEALARSVPGVTAVENRLVVAAS